MVIKKGVEVSRLSGAESVVGQCGKFESYAFVLLWSGDDASRLAVLITNSIDLNPLCCIHITTQLLIMTVT